MLLPVFKSGKMNTVARPATLLSGSFVRDDGSRFRSGTEYEFEDAFTAYQENGTPRILAEWAEKEPRIKDPQRVRKLIGAVRAMEVDHGA